MSASSHRPRRKQRARVGFQSTAPSNFSFRILVDFEDDDARDDDESTSIMDSGRKTCDMTVLSTQHGRARRFLRNIQKHDLRTCIKYGIKRPGRICPRTGKHRWLYTYQGLTYVTDYTSRTEITSFWEPVRITGAFITPEMYSRRNQLQAAIKADPSVCNKHTIVIVDQSGSMKGNGGQGFRTKSQAAYGILALEYLADQLHRRRVKDEAMNAFTVIEMGVQGTVFLEDEPLTWVLFNRLLFRQTAARPKGHGMYNNSLALARSLINQRLSQTQSMMRASPCFKVIFLSDSKPRDCSWGDENTRTQLLQQMALDFGPKLTFKAIALGDPHDGFAILERMVNTLRCHGVPASFDIAQPTNTPRVAAQEPMGLPTILEVPERQAMSRTSCNMNADNEMDSAHPINMLRVAAREPTGLPTILEDLERRAPLRKSSPSNDNSKFIAHTNDVIRWRFDREKEKAGKQWPWKEAKLVHPRAVGFEMESRPFAEGKECQCFKLFEIDADGKRLGKAMVAKDRISRQLSEGKLQFHLDLCRDQSMAQSFASKFNNRIAKCPELKPSKTGMKLPTINFLDCTMYGYEAEDEDGELSFLSVESYLKGKFTRFTGSDGHARQARGHDSAINLVVGQVPLHDFLHAFSHFTFVDSRNERFVGDLQGVLVDEARSPRFKLTAPFVCHCNTDKARMKQGDQQTNLGMKRVHGFLRTHQCNAVCRALGLAPTTFPVSESMDVCAF